MSQVCIKLGDQIYSQKYFVKSCDQILEAQKNNYFRKKWGWSNIKSGRRYGRNTLYVKSSSGPLQRLLKLCPYGQKGPH